MANKVNATDDVLAIKGALLKIEGQYGIPPSNELHKLLAEGLLKYADALGIDPTEAHTMGGGPKTPPSDGVNG